MSSLPQRYHLKHRLTLSFITVFKCSNKCFKSILLIYTFKRMCFHYCPTYVVSNLIKEDCCISYRKILEQLSNIVFCEWHKFRIWTVNSVVMWTVLLSWLPTLPEYYRIHNIFPYTLTSLAPCCCVIPKMFCKNHILKVYSPTSIYLYPPKSTYKKPSTVLYHQL